MPLNVSNREKISLDKARVTADTILDICEDFGVCIIDSYLSEDQINAIRSEVKTIYDNIHQKRGVRTHFKQNYQHALSIDYGKLDKSTLPAIKNLVLTPEFESVVSRYYDEDDVLYPSNLFIARSYGTEDSPEGVLSDGPPYALHHDRVNHFKFFFYLTDVTLDDGPTHFAPGLHTGVKEQRLERLNNGQKASKLSNTIEDVDQEIVPAIGEAGTLLVFDTDTPHRAGGLSEGHSREILRIDSYSPKHSSQVSGIGYKINRRYTNLLEKLNLRRSFPTT